MLPRPNLLRFAKSRRKQLTEEGVGNESCQQNDENTSGGGQAAAPQAQITTATNNNESTAKTTTEATAAHRKEKSFKRNNNNEVRDAVENEQCEPSDFVGRHSRPALRRKGLVGLLQRALSPAVGGQQRASKPPPESSNKANKTQTAAKNAAAPVAAPSSSLSAAIGDSGVTTSQQQQKIQSEPAASKHTQVKTSAHHQQQQQQRPAKSRKSPFRMISQFEWCDHFRLSSGSGGKSAGSGAAKSGKNSSAAASCDDDKGAKSAVTESGLISGTGNGSNVVQAAKAAYSSCKEENDAQFVIRGSFDLVADDDNDVERQLVAQSNQSACDSYANCPLPENIASVSVLHQEPTGRDEKEDQQQQQQAMQPMPMQENKNHNKAPTKQSRKRHRTAIATWPLDKQTVNDNSSFGDAEDLANVHLKGRIWRKNNSNLATAKSLPARCLSLSSPASTAEAETDSEAIGEKHIEVLPNILNPNLLTDPDKTISNSSPLQGSVAVADQSKSKNNKTKTKTTQTAAAQKQQQQLFPATPQTEIQHHHHNNNNHQQQKQSNYSHRRPFAQPFEQPSTNWFFNATGAVCDEGTMMSKKYGRRRRSYDDQEGDNDISIIMQCDHYAIDEEQQQQTNNESNTGDKLALAKSLLDLDYNSTVRLFIQKSSLNWNFNSFTFDALCCGRSLTELLLHLFDYYNLYNIFNLNIINVLKCFRLLEFGYHSTNPYHNSIHAADVTQAMHCFIQENKIRKHMTHLETLCSILAAVCHDLDHPGVNQTFLVATRNPLVDLYNNCSVLENHHWHFALAIFKESAIFEHLSDEIRAELKEQLKTLILATDIAHQNEYLQRFKTLTASSKFSMLNADDRSLVLQMALKCADLGNPCRPWILSKCWSEQICTEFYRQGDFERKLSIQLTPMCQRRKASVASIQSDFFRIIVLPLLELWHKFLRSPLSRLLMTNLNHNYERWQKANRIVQQMRRRKSFASLEPVVDDDDDENNYNHNYEQNDDDADDPSADQSDNNRHQRDTNHHPNGKPPNSSSQATNSNRPKFANRGQFRHHINARSVRRKAVSDLVKSDNERLHNLRSIHLDRLIQRMPKFVM